MKKDEICFFIACWFFRNKGISVRKVISMMGEIIHYKRCWYLLEKWDRLGFYNYGVTLDLGWFYPDKLPKRYADLIQQERMEEETWM